MSSMTVFPISPVNSLRAKAEKACPDPGDGPSGWSKSRFDPMRLLSVFDTLRIKSGFVLRAYQFRAGGDGNGLVLATPYDAPFPEPKDCPVEGPPQPLGSSENLMAFIDGDGTPWSYFSASLFSREAGEFGAMWHGCFWSTHVILGTDPWHRDLTAKDRRKHFPHASGTPEEWEWTLPRPEVWEPTFEQNGDVVTIRLHTFSGLGQEAIYRWTDSFKAGSFEFKTTEEVIAEGSAGFVF